jgi:hypothetical protein
LLSYFISFCEPERFAVFDGADSFLRTRLTAFIDSKAHAILSSNFVANKSGKVVLSTAE